MNYQATYDRIIYSAKLRIPGSSVHYDKHHIIPKSMGGSDDPANLVNLTDREHFVVHTLLWKIHRNRSMTSALWIMSQNKRYHYKEMNSNRYAELREEFRRNQTNQKIYKFENIITGEIFKGIRKEFRQYANISYSECLIIVKNGAICETGYKSATDGINWKLHGATKKERLTHNKDLNIYEFENVYTGGEFIGTRKQFDKQYSNRSFEVVNNIRLANGWKLKGAVPKKISKNKIAHAITNKGFK